MALTAWVRLAADVARVLQVLPRAELVRRLEGPRPALAWARACGARARPRSEHERSRLRRAIRLVDRLVPTGANCYRRCLLAAALDPETARTPLHLGFKAGAGPGSGHAWLADETPTERYDASFVM